MGEPNVERRRGRRVDVQAPLLIRRHGTPPHHPVQERTTNISLHGVYFETEQDTVYHLNDVVVASVSIPEPETRQFPFTRVAGRSRVVRVEQLSQARRSGRQRVGIALEFSEDVTALTAIPARD